MTEDDPGLVLFRQFLPKLNLLLADYVSGLSVLEYEQLCSWCRDNLDQVAAVTYEALGVHDA